MRASSILEIKQKVYEQISCSSLNVRTPIGLGRAKSGKENILAVRIYEEPSFWRNKLNWLRRLACGEIDVKFVGEVTAIPPSVNHLFSDKSDPWNRRRVRPLRIGSSISHGDVTAGTLGCFVTDDRGRTHILSNNHVIANSNGAKIGDKICQPGTYDGGRLDSDTVAQLSGFIRINDTGNLVDAATAGPINAGTFDPTTVHDKLGVLRGLHNGEVEPGDLVAKFGRTTGVTLGRVSAVEVDNVRVGYHGEEGPRIKVFDSQIEIEGRDGTPFCQGGDSGSMIVSHDSTIDRYAVGLLFAGGGRPGGKHVTYANYMSKALSLLGVKLHY